MRIAKSESDGSREARPLSLNGLVGLAVELPAVAQEDRGSGFEAAGVFD